MKTYIPTNIHIVALFGLITTIVYTLTILNTTNTLFFSVILFFIGATIFWSIVFGLESKALPTVTLICVVLAIIYMVYKGGIDHDYMYLINGLILNSVKLFGLIGGLYYIIKDFVTVKVNVVFFPLFIIYYIYVVYSMI